MHCTILKTCRFINERQTMKTTNPFDFSQFFQPFDLNALTKQWQEMLSGYNIPNVDISALQQIQKKNLEALAAANKATIEGAQHLMQRQAEMMQAAFSEATQAAKSLTGIHDPQELAAAQVKLVEDAMSKSMANANEISEMVKKAHEEASKAITDRVAASIEEMKAGK